MDFLNSAQEFFDPITKPIRNAQAVVSQPITDAISGSYTTADQISGEMNQFRERVVQDLTNMGNVASSIGDQASTSIEKSMSTIQAIGDNPELLPQMVVQSGEVIGDNPELLTHIVPYPSEV